nr:SMC family ATPase [Lysinibacillus timonensis]
MKPIKLTMRAFGPYKNEEVIDFTKLHDNRLFVISGATGAGKTTIFDGLCFALYGQGSGSDRKDTKMLRSDFADDDVHTSVELVFELGQKNYRILRQMGHVKKGRKTATGEKYEFYEVLPTNEEVAVVERQKVTDINHKIEELIGLTYDQFSQIVMLPQGEFRKLLTSQTENKEEILRKIFKTNRYGDMALKLEKKKQHAEQRLTEARVMKNSYLEQLSGALPNRESILFTTLDKNSNINQIQTALENELQFYEQKIIEDRELYKRAFELHQQKYNDYVAHKSLNERIDAYEQNQKKLFEIASKKQYFEKMKMEYDIAIKASQIDPVYKQLILLEREVQQQRAKLVEVNKQYEISKINLEEQKKYFDIEKHKQDKRDEAFKHVNELEKLIPIFEEIDNQVKRVNTISNQNNQLQEHVNNLETKILQKKNNKASIEASIEQLELTLEQLPLLMVEQANLKEIVQAIERYNKTQKEILLLNEQFQDTVRLYEKAKQVYDQTEANWLSNQAALLASSLSPGTPCPVCGSREHHVTHRELSDIVDEKEMKQLKAILDQKQQMKAECQSDLKTANSQLEEIYKELQSFNVSLDNQTEMIERFNEVRETVVKLQNDNKLLSELKQQFKKLESEQQQLELDYKQLDQLVRDKKSELIQQQTILEQKRLSIPNNLKTRHDLQLALNQAVSLKDQLYAAWEHAQKSYQQAQTEVLTNGETLNMTSKQLEESTIKFKNLKSEFMEILVGSGFETIEEFLKAKRSEVEVRQLHDQYLNYMNVLHSLTEQVNKEKEQLQNIEKVDLSALEEELDGLKRDYERAHQNLNESNNCKEICLDYLNKLIKITTEIEELEVSSYRIVDLYNILRGQNNRKISFERYVQMGYLEQITEAANIRLKNLSKGQFYLQCSDRQESHGRQSGLSLDVYDTYTGQSRDVKSLSGGEKFNASLCLALGMADVIQSYQGNVRIDTMFIDEGFGSLDEESLMKAIDTLIDLQKTGRMIGVISHVAELKAAMPAILQVEKRKEGYSKTSILLK